MHESSDAKSDEPRAREGKVIPLSELFASIDTEVGRQRLKDYLATTPFPHFEAAESPGLLVRIDADGTRTVGRFVGRQFEPVE